jgi:hypothetical protein
MLGQFNVLFARLLRFLLEAMKDIDCFAEGCDVDNPGMRLLHRESGFHKHRGRRCSSASNHQDCAPAAPDKVDTPLQNVHFRRSIQGHCETCPGRRDVFWGDPQEEYIKYCIFRQGIVDPQTFSELWMCRPKESYRIGWRGKGWEVEVRGIPGPQLQGPGAPIGVGETGFLKTWATRL